MTNTICTLKSYLHLKLLSRALLILNSIPVIWLVDRKQSKILFNYHEELREIIKFKFSLIVILNTGREYVEFTKSVLLLTIEWIFRK